MLEWNIAFERTPQPNQVRTPGDQLSGLGARVKWHGRTGTKQISLVLGPANYADSRCEIGAAGEVEPVGIDMADYATTEREIRQELRDRFGFSNLPDDFFAYYFAVRAFNASHAYMPVFPVD